MARQRKTSPLLFIIGLGLALTVGLLAETIAQPEKPGTPIAVDGAERKDEKKRCYRTQRPRPETTAAPLRARGCELEVSNPEVPTVSPPETSTTKTTDAAAARSDDQPPVVKATPQDVNATDGDSPDATDPTAASGAATGALNEIPPTNVDTPLPAFVARGLDWLVKAQHENGGWGAGSHANQQQRDARAVSTDPATTAFTAMSLLRLGHSPISGEYRDAVRRATEYLLRTVENADAAGPRITNLQGTQPQAKLGPLVDTSMTTQFLARLLPLVKSDAALHRRVDTALDKCIAKLESSQQTNGSWGGGGWAPVLQSSIGCTALELARGVGKEVSSDSLKRAREYQKNTVDIDSGRAKAGDAAGVELYAFSSAQRANAEEARRADDIVEKAKREGKIDQNAEVDEKTLRQIGVAAPQARALSDAWKLTAAQNARLDDESLLSGFGNNGGEEFLSYLTTSESLIITGGDAWTKWNRKMHERLAKVQNQDGSWTGHHCITSPVFCTAAAVQCLTVARDTQFAAKTQPVLVGQNTTRVQR